MVNFALGSPPVAPPQPILRKKGLGLVWVGPDGSEWDLADWRSGVVLTRGGVEGLHFPKITKQKSTSLALPGDTIRGWQTDPRDVIWPIYTYGDGSDEWLARHDAFFHTLHPSNPGTWKATAGGQTRTLQLTGVFDIPHQYDRDPLWDGWALYSVALEASQPYWAGEPITFGEWHTDAPQDFIGPDGGPPFNIGDAQTTNKATASNPGDVELWPVWTIVGPFSAGLTIGVGDVCIVVPFAIDAGKTLLIDTNRRRPVVTLDGVNAKQMLGLQSYASIPADSDVPLTVVASGTGTISAAGTPLYFRAFGRSPE